MNFNLNKKYVISLQSQNGNNMKKQSISLLNYEGDVFKIIKNAANSNLFHIVDCYGEVINYNSHATLIISIYLGRVPIETSKGKCYNIGEAHPDAKPTHDQLLNFLSL
jgi:cystathionine beta-lyase family protein involved in aluminum resistance